MTTTTAKKLGLVKHAKAIAAFQPIFIAVTYSRVRYDNPESWEHKAESSRWDISNDDMLPEGFKFLGKGVSRAAYLGPDGVAYKVPHHGWGADACTSEESAYLHKKEQAKKAGVHLARCYWHVKYKVLAMEHCPKARDYDDREDYKKMSSLNLYDIHKGNAWIDTKGRLVMVDYAS